MCKAYLLGIQRRNHNWRNSDGADDIDVCMLGVVTTHPIPPVHQQVLQLLVVRLATGGKRLKSDVRANHSREAQLHQWPERPTEQDSNGTAVHASILPCEQILGKNRQLFFAHLHSCLCIAKRGQHSGSASSNRIASAAPTLNATVLRAHSHSCSRPRAKVVRTIVCGTSGGARCTSKVQSSPYRETCSSRYPSITSTAAMCSPLLIRQRA